MNPNQNQPEPNQSTPAQPSAVNPTVSSETSTQNTDVTTPSVPTVNNAQPEFSPAITPTQSENPAPSASIAQDVVPAPSDPMSTETANNMANTAMPEQPMNATANPNDKPKSSTLKIVILAVLGVFALIILIVMGTFGYAVYQRAQLQKKPESTVGAKFIESAQKKDYAAISTTIAPEYNKLADRVYNLTNSDKQKEAFYKEALKQLVEAIPASGKPITLSITTNTSDGIKYSVVVYKLDSKYVSVWELYDGSQPKVVDAIDGQKPMTNSEFKSSYTTFKNNINSANTYLDSIEKAIEFQKTRGSSAIDITKAFQKNQ